VIPLIDLGPFHRQIRADVLRAFRRVYDSGRYILGEEVEAFERELADSVGARASVGVSSGTDALVCALSSVVEQSAALQSCEVITSPFTFMATASAILRVTSGLRFCDVESQSFGLDPEQLVGALSPQTRAVVPVHLYGLPCRIREIVEQCRLRAIAVVEDAAQALGARVDGRWVGSLGDLGCYSFFPAKSLGALGDGGAVATSQRDARQRLLRIRAHGAGSKDHHEELGGNYRLDALQAAVLRVKLQHLGRRIALARQHAEYYAEAFREVGELVTPAELPGSEGSFSLYTLRVLSDRQRLRAALHDAGIQTGVYYSRPLHLQPALRHLGYAVGDFPVAERLCEEVLSLPLYPELRPSDRDRVVRTVRQGLGYSRD
jgi:dTDP-4-amino-4,6-dideoxygalactose transaminase